MVVYQNYQHYLDEVINMLNKEESMEEFIKLCYPKIKIVNDHYMRNYNRRPSDEEADIISKAVFALTCNEIMIAQEEATLTKILKESKVKKNGM
jgi:hypothetical protein